MESVLTISGKMREHYGLTDLKQCFAEMTECYFGSSVFYPLVTGELRDARAARRDLGPASRVRATIETERNKDDAG